jgi:hypothetical protein
MPTNYQFHPYIYFRLAAIRKTGVDDKTKFCNLILPARTKDILFLFFKSANF